MNLKYWWEYDVFSTLAIHFFNVCDSEEFLFFTDFIPVEVIIFVL